MSVVKRETLKGYGPAIVTKKVKSYADDPYFLEKAAKAKESLSKTDLSILKEKQS
jgi:hypothetical protein